MDSESLMKKGKIAAGGDQLTEVPTTKNPLHKLSNLVVIKETPQTLTSTSQETNQRNKKNALAALAQLIPTHITRPQFNSIDRLSSLLECHRLQQLPLPLQQAHWDKLLELEYLPEAVPQPILLGTSLEEEEDLEEDHCMVENLLKETWQTP
jgi:hypothetical protein